MKRGDEDLSIDVRICDPDADRMKTWKPAVAEKLMGADG